MSKNKTVVLFVNHVNEYEEVDRIFTEVCEVGKNQHFKTPSEFINSFSLTYRKLAGDDKFTIVNVVIG